MGLPHFVTTAAYDRAQGRDETPEPAPECCYHAARDFLFALDRGFLSVAYHAGSSYVSSLRAAVAAETERRAADEAELRAAGAKLAGLGR